MACGFYAIINAIQGEFVTAAYLIILATFFDLIDGRVARLTNTTSAFGVQYDSLADLSSFGIAPAILLYTWSLESFGRVGWVAAFLFFVCGALRLARFNVQSQQPNSSKSYVTGLTIPFAAGTASTAIILHRYLGGEGTLESLLVLFMVFGLAFLMVSTIRFRSFKDLNLGKRGSFQSLVVIVMVALLILTNPPVMMFICATTYIFVGVFTEIWRLGRKAVTGVDSVPASPEAATGEQESSSDILSD